MLDGATAVVVFLTTAVLLGVPALIYVVAFLIRPHDAGILPEWSHIPVLALCMGGIGYVSFKVAIWVQKTLANP